MTRCRAITASGAQCKVVSGISPAGFCLWHDPDPARKADAAAARARAQERRGKARPRVFSKAALPSEVPPEPTTLDDVVQWSSWVSVAVATGRIDPTVAAQVIAALRTLQGGLEKRDLGREVERLHKRVDDFNRGGDGST